MKPLLSQCGWQARVLCGSPAQAHRFLYHVSNYRVIKAERIIKMINFLIKSEEAVESLCPALSVGGSAKRPSHWFMSRGGSSPWG